MQKKTKNHSSGLVLRGRNDNIPRRVEHIPIDMDRRKTVIGKKGHYLMFYWQDGVRTTRVVDKTRLEHMAETERVL